MQAAVHVLRLAERRTHADDFCHEGATMDEIVQIRGINKEGNRGKRIEIYSGESISASNAFRLEIITVRPSI